MGCGTGRAVNLPQPILPWSGKYLEAADLGRYPLTRETAESQHTIGAIKTNGNGKNFTSTAPALVRQCCRSPNYQVLQEHHDLAHVDGCRNKKIPTPRSLPPTTPPSPVCLNKRSLHSD